MDLADSNKRDAQAQSTKPAATRLTKPQALAIVRKLKRALVVASIVGFGTFGGLAINHTVGTTRIVSQKREPLSLRSL